MNKNQMIKRAIAVFLFVLVVATLTAFGPKINQKREVIALAQTATTTSIISQKMTGVTIVPSDIYRVYYKNQEIGRMHDMETIQPLLKKVYASRYQEKFPSSKLSLGEDIHISKEVTFFQYENVDEQILAYIDSNEYFSIEVTKVIFSNGAEAYVKNIEDFAVAKDLYVLNFISKEAYKNLQNKIIQPELIDYGYRDLSIDIAETTEISKGFAPINKILKNVDEIIYYLSYGYDTIPKFYTVEKYDTVEGIAQMYGLEADHIVMINRASIKYTNQILEIGSSVNVTYYNSPITITVTKELLRSEPHNPESTQYIKDPTLNQGVDRQVVPEKVGIDDVRVLETWVNGVLMKNEILSTVVKVPSQREVRRIGSKIIPGIGTGVFRYPIDYPTVTCRWGCYYGHKAVDLQNRYNRYGNIYASDRGTVIKNSYDSISGYFIKINHANGFITHYGHMKGRSPVSVGTKVEKGQVIGTIGMTGKASGPHVHFAIEKNGVRIDPCRLLRC